MDAATYADCNHHTTLLTKAIVVMLAVAYAAVLVSVGVAAQASVRVAIARAVGGVQDVPAEQAGSEEYVAPAVATGSRQQGAQMQLDPSRSALNAEAFVSQPGELLFTSGSANLSPGIMGELNKLVDFLGRNPDSSVVIRGYTDSVGNEEYNQGLSDRRANSAKAYLVARGIGSTRLSAFGMGQSTPAAANDSAVGRQQNRRLEVVISNPPAASAHRTRREQMLVLLMLLESTSGSLGKIFR